MQEIYGLKVFNGIDKNIVDLIIKNSKIETYSEGEIIIKQGEKSNGKGYIIKSGEVIVEIGGKEIAKLGIGEIFGEIALLNEEQRTATIKAISETQLIVLTQEYLLEIIDSGNESVNRDIMFRLEQNLINNY
ncbi:MAG: cyclic nucleotide-binding domain-containing protein [Candidatus Gracilibacteria bacterium]|nr:cyclic nucleotide-binding domain-containing protein [Candidatus Gracilibacteria bacterium]